MPPSTRRSTMSSDSNDASATATPEKPRRKTIDRRRSTVRRKHEHEPNYWLLGSGIAMIALFFGLYLFLPREASAPLRDYQHIPIVLGLTLSLYGLFPAQKLKAEFGTLSAVGPAALGVFLLLYFGQRLNSAYAREDAARNREEQLRKQLIVLQASPTGIIDRYAVDDSVTIALLNVDSFKKTGVREVLDEIERVLRQGFGLSSASVTLHQRHAYTSVANGLQLDPARAAAVYDTFLVDKARADALWSQLVAETSASFARKREGDEAADRISATPFAMVAIYRRAPGQRETRTEIRTLLPGDRISVAGRTYSIPVFANPKMRVVKGISEAIVLESR